MGRKALLNDPIEMKVRLERSEWEELHRLYPTYGQRGKLVRAMIRRHIRIAQGVTEAAAQEILKPEEIEA